MTLLFSIHPSPGGHKTTPRGGSVHFLPSPTQAQRAILLPKEERGPPSLCSALCAPYDGKLHVMQEWEHEIIRESTRHDDRMTATPTQAQGALTCPLLRNSLSYHELILAPCAPPFDSCMKSIGLGCVTLSSRRMKGNPTPSPPYAQEVFP